MSNYFTSIENSEGRYFGIVYDVNNNNEVYRTKIYDTQLQASKDANIWATTQKTPDNVPLPSIQPQQQTITTTSYFRTTPSGRCCGR